MIIIKFISQSGEPPERGALIFLNQIENLASVILYYYYFFYIEVFGSMLPLFSFYLIGLRILT